MRSKEDTEEVIATSLLLDFWYFHFFRGKENLVT